VNRDIPLVITAYIAWKSIKGTKIIPLADIPLREALDEVARNPEPPEPKHGLGYKILNIFWS
jgi:amino acid transporter